MTEQHISQHRTEQDDDVDRSGYTHSVKRRLSDPSWLARAAGVGLRSISIGFVVLLVFVLETGGDLTLITQPLPMQIALALPTVIAVLTIVTTVGTVLAWWNSYWSLRARLHYTVLTILGLGFSWQLAVIGFLPS